jgi:glycine hydroxymethyltransferase
MGIGTKEMEIDTIRKTDPEIAELILKELNRQRNTIELIASENFSSNGNSFD